MAEEQYITVRAEIVRDEIKAYVTGSNLQEGHPIYREFSKHAIEFITHLTQISGKGLELRLTLRD
jgi:hypothetical protein